ncbi:response regulator transcription factor [Paenibacillus sp. URB8-2]|uniref:response regulator transcription factor n=1 Tax=Paenibacillus sp. URB8-2 TaxID=2741301 RepID=UPI0015B98F6B|nr:response regulator [Paenibacillus sp. URB8-2]BCG57380.1 hypothetical protein PUR_08050 [Paenibacillus sp. URB8-2]
MKVLIVDDETDVRDSIRLLVDWEDYRITDVLEASDGSSAMTLIESEQPEIIFTDVKMPNVDGMTLLQWIEDNAPDSKRIVISGYDDYAYIRKTMMHGGLDYLLKPIKRSELLDALRRAVDTWLKDEESRRLNIRKDVEINKTMPMYWDKILSNAVSQPGFYPTVANELHASFGWSAVRECRVAMMITDPLPRVVLDKFGGNLDLLYFLMGNICNEVIGPPENGYAFKHADPNYGLILLLTGDLTAADGKLRAMNDALYKVLRARFHCACSSTTAFPHRLHDGFEQMLQAARGVSFLKNTDRIHYEGDTPPPVPAQRIALADFANPLTAAVHRGEPSRIGSAVAKWIQTVGELEAVTWEQLKYWRYEYELLRGRLLKDTDRTADTPAHASSPGLFPISPDSRLSLEDWRREWTDDLCEIAKALKEASLREYDVIHSIKQYIDANYRENLSLQDIAGQFFLSREYVSRRFKQVYNENLSDYLEQVRIEQAKLLLANGQYKVSSVAEMVGYQDGRYFSKIFGKLTGMTPREWRKEAGQEA